MKKIERNTIFHGDNLPVMRDYILDESIDLIYLDPPFNPNRSYNVLFKNESGKEAETQIQTFDDAWHWGESAEATYAELMEGPSFEVTTMIEALRQFIGANQMMAYIVMMTARLVEMRRILKPTGSIYLHCDPTASHYLKIILDTLFGAENFKNEVIWKRTSAHSSAKRFRPVHEVLLYYTKSDDYVWNPQYTIYDAEYLDRFYRNVDKDGRRYTSNDLTAAGVRHGSSGEPWRGIDVTAKSAHWKFTIEHLAELDRDGRILWPAKGKGEPRYKRYLDEMRGTSLQDVITNIDPISAQAAERLGYPTQKPLALLERIIRASSNKGDVVLDPFSGCGTAIAASQKLERQWIGIDITYLAIAMHKSRLKDMYNLEPGKDYEVVGEPTDLSDAIQLAQDDQSQFQWWALSLIKARPVGSIETGHKKGKKGGDSGIDGIIPSVEDASGKLRQVLVQVKSGHVGSETLRNLRDVLDREHAPIGVLITLKAPSAEMQEEVLSCGFYYSEVWQQKYPAIQILTIEELLNGKQVKMPPSHGAFKKARRLKKGDAKQARLGI